MDKPHIPVLLKEVIEGLNLQKGDTFIDATLGAGGHAYEISKIVGKKGLVVGFDEDMGAIELASERLKEGPSPYIVINSNFSNLKKELIKKDITQAEGFLFDLGISSMQLDSAKRGFSFRYDEPLLMTLNANPGKDSLKAYDLLNTLSSDDLKIILKNYGEERFAGPIAKHIVDYREREGDFSTTRQLVEVVEGAVPNWYKFKKIHPATKTFQALRIAVNDELTNLKKGLEDAWSLLSPGGRIVVISFHSLETRIVKDFFRDKAKNDSATLITKKAIKPTVPEIANNPRSRSAILRILEK